MHGDGEVLSFEALDVVETAGDALVQRRERARRERMKKLRHIALVNELTRRSALYRRWHVEDAARLGPDAAAAERFLIIRTPVPAVIETTESGERIFIQYARGRDSIACEYCKEPCPKEGRKFLVVVAPRGLWCPACARMGPAFVGDFGAQLRRIERRRLKTRLSSPTKTVTPAR